MRCPEVFIETRDAENKGALEENRGSGEWVKVNQDDL